MIHSLMIFLKILKNNSRNNLNGYFGLDQHTHLVARPLAEIISKYDLMELHVSLTNGLWRYESWGYPVGMFLFSVSYFKTILNISYNFVDIFFQLTHHLELS